MNLNLISVLRLMMGHHNGPQLGGCWCNPYIFPCILQFIFVISKGQKIIAGETRLIKLYTSKFMRCLPLKWRLDKALELSKQFFLFGVFVQSSMNLDETLFFRIKREWITAQARPKSWRDCFSSIIFQIYLLNQWL